eukprot:11994493-Karenia_brevis.AAC.1
MLAPLEKYVTILRLDVLARRKSPFKSAPCGTALVMGICRRVRIVFARLIFSVQERPLWYCPGEGQYRR